MKMHTSWILLVALVAGMLAGTAQAGVISYHPITGDADSDISSSKVYTHAIDFGAQTAGGGVATINGVVFSKGFPANTGSSSATKTTNTGNNYANVTGGMAALVYDMVYDDRTLLITLTGLTSGKNYRFRLYNRQFGTTASTRNQNIGFDADGIGTTMTIADAEDTGVFNADDASAPDPSMGAFDQVYAFTYDYALSAGVTSLKVYVNANPITTGPSYHLYGLTNEEVPPAITSLSPVDNSTEVASTPELVATFNQAIALTGSGSVTIRDVAGATDYLVISLPDSRVTVSGADLTISLAADPLGSGTEYAVRISSDAVENLFDSAFAGIADDTTWSFTTASGLPVISSLSPLNNAIGVAPDAVLVATFNKTVQTIPGGKIVITNLTAQTGQTITLDDGQVSASTADLSINLTGDLTLGHTYAVLIDGDSVEDESNNNFTGITDTNTWQFTVADKPAVNAIGAMTGVGSIELQGQVTGDGDVALSAVWIYFGDNDGEDVPGNWDTNFVFNVGDIEIGETFSTNVTGLLYGSPYYYRVQAENAHGETWSATEGPFTTLAIPVSELPTLEVDFNRTGYPAAQTDWEAFTADTTSPVEQNYVTPMASATEITVRIEGMYAWRRYSAITGTFAAMSNLLCDGPLGTMTLTLSGLSAGTYNIVTYHHCSQFGGGTLTLTLTDADVTDDEKFSGVTTTGTTPSAITSNAFSFVSDGSDVLINMTQSGSGGTMLNGFELDQMAVLPAAVETTTAAGITATTAALQGELNATQAVFTVTAYWSTTDHQSPQDWIADTAKGSAVVGVFTNVMAEPLSIPAEGLASETVYFYTFHAANAATNLWADNGTFQTLPASDAPEVSVLAAEDVLPFSATLRGELTAGGLAGAYFVWGTSVPDPANDTNLWANVASIGDVVEETFTHAITGLSAPQTYHYSVYVTNDAGEAWSLATGSFSTPAYLNIMTNTAGTAGDTWNNSANWSLGRVPTGFDWAVVNTNLSVGVNNVATPAYSGRLILEPGASIGIILGYTNAFGDEAVVLREGTEITIGTDAAMTLTPPITVEGDTWINGSAGVDGQNQQRILAGPIGGAGSLTLWSGNKNIFKLEASNSISGGITVTNGSCHLEANANGALGTGNVYVRNAATLEIKAGLTGTMAASAELHLDGIRGSLQTTKLELNSSETVDKLFVDGVQLNAGVYTSASGLTDSVGDPLIGGAGTLTVLTGPPAVAPELVGVADDVFGNTIYQNYGTITFTVMFDLGMDPETITSADFTNKFDAAVSIGAVTEVNPTVFTVPVTVEGPGQLQLQIKEGADLRSSVNEAMDTSAAIADGKVITVLAGNAPATTITGTTGGNDSWNEVSNWNWGVPSGEQAAAVAAAVTAQVNTAPPAYDGTLTLQSGSTLRINSAAGLAALPTASNALIMNSTSTLNDQSNGGDRNVNCPLALNGSASVGIGGSWQTRRFKGPISGSGSLSLSGGDAVFFHFDASNTLSGGTIVNSSSRVVLFGNINGAFGTGSVTVNGGASLQLGAGLGSVIADTATLYLNGGKSSEVAAKVVLNSDETVYSLVVDDEVQRMGTYGATSSGAIYEDDTLFSGSGVLNVLGPLLPSVFRFR